MTDDFDDLDRALFALPLEAPPPELRAAILRATIDAPRSLVAEPLARPWELGLCGVALAIGTWLILAIVTSPALVADFAGGVIRVVHAFGDPMTLEWLAFGAVATTAFWYITDIVPRLPSRGAGT